VSIAPFAQFTFISASRLTIDGGVRADYQSGLATIVSPRFSAAGRAAGFTLRAGVGLFAHAMPDSVFASVIARDGEHLQQFLADAVSLVQPSQASLTGVPTIRSEVSPDMAPPRQWMARTSMERSFGLVAAGAEYSWSDERHRLGSERVGDGTRWIDLLESNRGAERQRLHIHARASGRGQQAVVNYEWVRACDDSDGAFSFPERTGDLASEWARTAGMSPHTVTAVGTLRLPAAISLTATASWRSAAPYNVTTGIDVVGNGLRIDRGGRPRNGADGPRYRSLDLYAFRRVRVPLFGGTDRRSIIDVGVQADNVLDTRNEASIGSIVGSPSFGQPLAAFKGRTIRVTFSLD
jgi:hypothetical protein